MCVSQTFNLWRSMTKFVATMLTRMRERGWWYSFWRYGIPYFGIPYALFGATLIILTVGPREPDLAGYLREYGNALLVHSPFGGIVATALLRKRARNNAR